MLFNPLAKPQEPTPLRGTLVAATLATTVAAVGLAFGAATRSDAGSSAEETKTLDQLYAAAKAEGGKLVVHAGGDRKNQRDDTEKAFEQCFPGVTVDMVVVYGAFKDPDGAWIATDVFAFGAACNR